MEEMMEELCGQREVIGIMRALEESQERTLLTNLRTAMDNSRAKSKYLR